MSPIKRTGVRDTLIRALSRTNLIVSAYPVVDEEDDTQSVDYLPMMRTKDNPNARGGCITVIPEAPNHRLDPSAKSPTFRRDLANMDLHCLLIDLGLLEKPDNNSPIHTVGK